MQITHQEATQSAPAGPGLDLAPPKPWRRFVPAPLRSVFWADDAAARYDAFLSYSWQSEKLTSPPGRL